jgi:sugar/nucleoside kinase (ribokinase family)
MFIVMGTTTVDLYISGIENMPRFEDDEFTVGGLAWCSKPLTMTMGGNGANSAYVLATLGAPTALVSAAGRDLLGDTMVGWLQERGIDLRSFQRSERYATATDTVIMDEKLNRAAFYHPGAQHYLTFEDVSPAVFETPTALLITGYTLLPAFRPAGYEAVMKLVRERDGITALDIGPAIASPVQLPELRPLLHLVDYLITNDYELGICTGIQDEAAAIQAMFEAGARHIVLKRGAEGATLFTHDGQRTDAKGYPVKAEVTVGAGDSFNAGFLYALAQGLPVARVLAFANATASIVVAGGRSVLGAPTRAQVEAFLEVRA